MPKIDKDKYYTEDSVAQYCVEKTFETLGTDWDRIIEPSAYLEVEKVSIVMTY